MEWKDFILQHDGDDLTRLVLSREKYPDVDVALSATTIECRRKLRDKVPEWYAHPELILPIRLSAEQCSSTPTARYKAFVAATAPEGTAFWEAGRPRPRGPQKCLIFGEPTVEGEGPIGKWMKSKLYPLGGAGMRRSRMESSHEGRTFRGGRIADLTGGLGVDSWAFSEVFDEVLYNEMVPELAEAARHNFAALGVGNIRVTNFRIVPSADAFVDDDAAGKGGATIGAILGDFRPDIIYLDPARRGAGGRKVFLLEDCSPDVTALLGELFAAAPYILLKLSPMADISMLLSRLPHVREVHAVASGGECKELLLLLERGFEGETEVVAVEIPEPLRKEDGAEKAGDSFAFARNDRKGTWNDKTGLCGDGANVGDRKEFRFRRSEEAEANPVYGEPGVGDLLFKPGKALSKAGCFNLISARLGLRKLGPNSHLYCLAYVAPSGEERVRTKKAENERTPQAKEKGTYTQAPMGIEEGCPKLEMAGRLQEPIPALPGKWFRIAEVLPLDKRGIAEAGAKYPGADVSARGVPLSSDELALRLRKAGKKIPEQVRNDLSRHIFGVHCAMTASNLLLVCIPV